MKYDKGSFTTVPNRHVLKGEKATVQSVYLWLCDHSGSDGICFPSIRVLAKEAGCSERTVDSSLKKLVEIGVLSKENRFIENEQTTNLYQINIVSAPPSATIAPPLAQPLRTEPNPILTKPILSESEDSDGSSFSKKNSFVPSGATTSPMSESGESVRTKPREERTSEEVIRSVFDLFGKDVYSLVGRHKPQREAVLALLKTKGMGRIQTAMAFYRDNKHMEMCPKISKPYDLASKWDDLLLFRKRNNL